METIFQNLLTNSEISQELRDGSGNEREEIGEQQNENEAPKIDEVKKAIERLKTNRSPGPDNIIAELLKTKQEIIEATLQRRVCQIWMEEIIHEQWEDGLICPIHKKGDQLELNNYRRITLLNTGYKIFSNILYERLQPYMESIVGKYQCGFRKCKSTIDQIQSVRQILEKTSEYGLSTFHLFIDFTAAYDNKRTDKLLEALTEFKIPPKLIRLVKLTLKHMRCKVKIHNNLSEQSDTSTGLRQGDALSCTRFNLALEKVVRDSEIETDGTTYNKGTQILAYADDIVIVGRSTDALKETIKKLMKAAQVMGLTVNMQKTKYMGVTKRPTNTKMIVTGNQQYERVKEFKYLAATLTKENNVSTQIKQRIIMANETSYGLEKQLNSPYLK
jgi:sorting nexin-29